MSSWRITTNEIDRSQTLIPNVGNIGGMVIRSRRGDNTPVLFPPGQEQRILDTFGYPDATYPDTVEAIEYNKIAPLWINSVFSSTTDYRSGIIVTSDEVVGYVGTDATGEAAALQQAVANLNDAAVTNFAFTIPINAAEYFILYSKAPSETDYLKADVSWDAVTSTFGITLYINRNGTFEQYADEYMVSLVEGAKDGFGADIFIETVFEDHDLINVLLNPDANTGEGFSDDTGVIFTGSGKETDMATSLSTSWNKYQYSNLYPTKIFMDPSADATIPALFATLRSTYQKYSSYILPLPLGTTSATAVTTKDGYSLDNRGLNIYWNQGKVRYNNKKFWTSLVGRIGTKFAQMVNVYNGLAPSWQDENNHGGQLGSGILELENNPTEIELQTLDTAGVNPIIFDSVFGVMLASQKTAKTPGLISDDSYIGHSRLFDVILENIINQILIPQITKLNDDIHRRRAVVIGDSFMRPLTAPIPGLLNAYKIKCDSSNNDDTARAQRKFIYSLAVQVTPFSEFIEFNFIKAGQTITVDSVLQ